MALIAILTYTEDCFARNGIHILFQRTRRYLEAKRSRLSSFFNRVQAN